MAEIVAEEAHLAASSEAFAQDSPPMVEWIRSAKRMGFGDARLAQLLGCDEGRVRSFRRRHGIIPVYKRVDTCAAEFSAQTPYLYSCYDTEDEGRTHDTRKVIVLGGGPNRIGQGIEFDYCCVHAAQSLRAAGIETLIINCNPETVSTDYDTSDRLYFEPLTLEHVLNVVERERPFGVILSFGGQTPLRLAAALEAAGVPILGTPSASIHRAEDREAFGALLASIGLQAPPYGIARTVSEAVAVAAEIGYPVLLRPSFVLGGRAMAIARDEASLRAYLGPAFAESASVLVDRFLADAKEVDVDAVADESGCRVAGVMEHLEEAGIHSGDSMCSLPPYSLSPATVARIEAITRDVASALQIRGMLNLQVALQGDQIYVLEANPRASRTVPFVSKAMGTAWAKIATRVMLGEAIAGMSFPPSPRDLWAIKAPVFPFERFPDSRPVLGPEMRSTGEGMGLGSSFPEAFAKAALGTGLGLAVAGRILVLGQREGAFGELVLRCAELGLEPCAEETSMADALRSGSYALVLEQPLPTGQESRWEGLRRLAIDRRIPWVDNLAVAHAWLEAVAFVQRQSSWQVYPLQSVGAPSRKEVLK